MQVRINALILCVTIIILTANNCNAKHSQPNYTYTSKSQLSNPSTVALNSELYTISKKQQFLIITWSTGKLGLSCKLRVNPLDENIQGRLQASSLSNEAILVWGTRKTLGNTRYYTLLIVDPIKCKYTPVKLPEERRVHSDGPVFPAQIMIQEKSREFRIYYPEGSDCRPCPFRYNGEKREKGSYSLAKTSEPSHFWIDSYLRSSSFDKYFYAFNFRDGKSIVRIMGIYYDSEVQVQFNHTIDAASINTGTYRNTAICYKSSDNLSITCERLDMNLQPGFTWELPLQLTCNETVSDVSITVDKVGNTFIGVITTRRLFFFVYDVVSEIAADLDFGEVDESYVNREVKGIPLGNKFCLEAVVYSDSLKDAVNIVKCVDVATFIEDSARKLL